MNNTHHYEQLIEIFNGCFADEFNTRLIKGDDEPIHLSCGCGITVSPYRFCAWLLRQRVTRNFTLVHRR